MKTDGSDLRNAKLLLQRTEQIGLRVLNKLMCSQEESFRDTTKELRTLNFVSSLILLHFMFFYN